MNIKTLEMLNRHASQQEKAKEMANSNQASTHTVHDCIVISLEIPDPSHKKIPLLMEAIT